MHPFALNEKQIEQVSGGLRGFIIDNPLTPAPSLPIDDELTTLRIGEEGGAPPVDLT